MLLPIVERSSEPERVVLPEFRRRGDRDDTAALMRAAETGRPIHAPAGRYLVSMTAAENLPPTFRLKGDGAKATVFARSYSRPSPFILHADSGSPNPRDNFMDYRIQGLSFEDDVAQRGFSEFDYLVMLNGVTGALIEGVEFRGFRGDGLYIGSSTVRSQERHNAEITVRACHFDGMNANTRNAISVLDCDGLVVEGCTFWNVGRTGGPLPPDPMNPFTGVQSPGAIDIEPEPTGFSRVQNVSIRNNLFIGGGGYAVTLNMFENTGKAFQRRFSISNNRVLDRYGGFSARGFASGSDASIPYDIAILDNVAERCRKPFLVDGMHGLRVTNNRFIDCAEEGELGYHRRNFEVKLASNEFLRVGYERGFALWIRSSDGLVLRENTFLDCGLRDGSRGIPIAFVSGVSTNVSLLENIVENRSGRTTEATTVFAEASVDRRTLTVSGNSVRGPVDRGPTALF
ncbi:right-handed parallel beta-helix repeat-containing protein [Altererythrobacter sp. TH136]|uniref:right-handed parallel beta-helix repeat-containing protein n=1 Tax=Altererythrobacter sp. TH136 TaxID=2067415 RepID=UPI00143D301E|nr:right-handed parallel beta-helix repeat-containing protein [Altererythrobacter sp. TH136]